MQLLTYRYQLLLNYLGGLEGALGVVPQDILAELVRRPAEQTVVITADSHVFSLESPYGLESYVLSGDIYAVYNRRGRLLYQVARHGGIWGRNELDTRLVFSSKPFELYFVDAGGLVCTLLRGVDRQAIAPRLGAAALSNPVCTLVVNGVGNVYTLPGVRRSNMSAALVKLGNVTPVNGQALVIIEQDSWVYCEQLPASLPSMGALPGDRVADGLCYVRPTSPDLEFTL